MLMETARQRFKSVQHLRSLATGTRLTAAQLEGAEEQLLSTEAWLPDIAVSTRDSGAEWRNRLRHRCAQLETALVAATGTNVLASAVEAGAKVLQLSKGERARALANLEGDHEGSEAVPLPAKRGWVALINA